MELKPCPFCNGKAELTTRLGTGEPIYYISCTKCKALMGESRKIISTLKGKLYFDNKEDVINAWNKREEN